MRSLFTVLPLVAVLFGAGCASSSSEDNPTQGDDAEVNAGASDQNPAVGTPERKAFLQAAHAHLDPQLKNQPNEYVISWLKSKNGFTYLQGQIQGKGRDINWKNTVFREDVEAGIFDLNGTKASFTLLAKKQGSGFRVVDVVIAPTDVSGAGLSEPGLPLEIVPPMFHSVINARGDGDGDGDGRGDGDGDGDGDGR